MCWYNVSIMCLWNSTIPFVNLAVLRIIPCQQKIKRLRSRHLILPDMVTTESVSAKHDSSVAAGFWSLLYHMGILVVERKEWVSFGWFWCDKCVIEAACARSMCNRQGRACQEFFEEIFRELEVSVKSENIWILRILRKARDFWYVW